MTTLAPSRRTVRDRLLPWGLLESLATPHAVDRYLELLHPLLTVRELRASITTVDRPTADSVTLTLRPTRQWQGFRAGQFVQVSIDIDGIRRIRCYSPSCSQYRSDGCIELTVKAHAGGLVSQYLHRNARPGMVIGLSQADGAFTLPVQRPDRVLLISGGSGITPVLSMLRSLCDEGHAGEIVFLHYADSSETVAHRDDLRALAAAHDNVRVVFGHSRTDDGDVRGPFGTAHLDEIAPWHADAQTYLCGPPALMAGVREVFDGLGLADRLHTEEFQPTAVAPSDDEVTGTVSFDRSGTSAENTGATLLEQAEAAGLAPEHGCRMGICFSCTQIKTSGCTRNIRTGETDSDPDTEIQLCISVPVGDVALNV